MGTPSGADAAETGPENASGIGPESGRESGPESGPPAPTVGATDPTVPAAAVPADPSAAAPAVAGATKDGNGAGTAADPADFPAVYPAAPGAAARSGRGFRRGRLAFRHWRRTRPFWGGLLVALGGGEILFTYRAPFKVVLHFGMYGLAGYALPGILVVLGGLILFDREHRTFYSILAMLAAAGTWLTSNLGGFILGMLLGLLGSAMSYGWSNAVPGDAVTAEDSEDPKGAGESDDAADVPDPEKTVV